jgi:photosystem II stability/assembly factor-like uncharacterized protein
MTSERSLDFRLAAWLDEQATSVAPDDLLARSLARVEATRQRPAVLTRDAFRGPWIGAGRGPIAAPILLVLAVALIAILVVVGSQLVFPRLTVVVPPSPTPGPQSSSLPSQAPVETPVDRRPPAFAAGSGMFTNVRGFRAASETVAWFATDSAIYRTEDIGATWREVQPAGWTGAWSVALVDAQTAFLSPGGSPATVYLTHNGGTTWATARLDVGAVQGSPALSFRSPTDGYATFFDAEFIKLSKPGALHVYHTTDGGLTWSGPVPGAVPHMDQTSDKLYGPIGNYYWQSAGKAPGIPYDNRFFLSADGGATWAEYRFPISSISPRGALKSIRSIRLEDNGRLLIFMDAARNDGSGGAGIYESTDDPTAWRVAYGDPGDTDVQFLSDTTWVITSNAPSEVRRTFDAGATWTTVVPTTSLYAAWSHDWASPDVGWATEECRWLEGCTGDRSTLVVLRTTDGGATWTLMGQ